MAVFASLYITSKTSGAVLKMEVAIYPALVLYAFVLFLFAVMPFATLCHFLICALSFSV
jgi:hypothetical protein